MVSSRLPTLVRKTKLDSIGNGGSVSSWHLATDDSASDGNLLNRKGRGVAGGEELRIKFYD